MTGYDGCGDCGSVYPHIAGTCPTCDVDREPALPFDPARVARDLVVEACGEPTAGDIEDALRAAYERGRLAGLTDAEHQTLLDARLPSLRDTAAISARADALIERFAVPALPVTEEGDALVDELLATHATPKHTMRLRGRITSVSRPPYEAAGVAPSDAQFVEALRELVAAAAPVAWAMTDDCESAQAWERRAVALLNDQGSLDGSEAEP